MEIREILRAKTGENLSQTYGKCFNIKLSDAAVIIPFIWIEDQFNVLFTKRTNFVGNHRNQISFPGGVREKDDHLPLNTAMREFEEEVGYTINQSEIVGALEPEHAVTGYCIYPYVGILDGMKEFSLNRAEVDKILTIPLKWLTAPGRFTVRPYARPGYDAHPVVFFDEYEGEVIWGITASILLKFFSLIKK